MRGHSVVLLLLTAVLSIVLPITEGNIVNVNDLLLSGTLENIDLSHPFNNHTVYWPGARKFSFTKKHEGIDYRNFCKPLTSAMEGSRVVLLVVILSIVIPPQRGDVVNVNDLLLSGTLEYVDLSHPFDNRTVYWPGEKMFEFSKKFVGKSETGIWYSAFEFCAAEHGGTHMDAPYHFNDKGWTIGQIPFENLITALYFVDLSDQVKGDPDFIAEKFHFENLFQLNSKLKYTIIFRFGWSQYYNDTVKYLGTSHPGQNNLKFPGVSEDVAKWLATFENIVGVGVDTPSVDPGSSIDMGSHKVFCNRNMFILENVKIDRALLSNKCSVIMMPMNIYDGTGSPCRITAICPKVTHHGLNWMEN